MGTEPGASSPTERARGDCDTLGTRGSYTCTCRGEGSLAERVGDGFGAYGGDGGYARACGDNGGGGAPGD